MGKTINFKRTLAVCLAFLLFGLSCIFQTNNNNANAANTSVSYQVFHSQTGFYLRSYTLNPLNSQNNSRIVIGTDDRKIDWSKSGVVKILTDTSLGTGFVVDEHTIATAAHCVYDTQNCTGKKIKKVLLFDSNGNIELSVIPVESHVPSEFIKNNGPSTEYKNVSDYALLTVEEDLSDYMCFNIGSVPDKSLIEGAEINVTGFPGTLSIEGSYITVNTFSIHNMYTGTGTILHFTEDDGRIMYNADTTGGNSGGPVYITESRCGRVYNTVIAVHDQGGNYGTLIDTNVLHFYTNNENTSY